MATRIVRNWLILLGVVVVLVGGYAAAGFLGVPWLVRKQVLSFVTEHYGRQASLGPVRFNPFTFTFEARDFSMPDVDKQRLLSFERLYFDLDVKSVWRRAPSFTLIQVERPYARALIRKNGDVNLADLAQPFEAKAPPTKEEKPTRLFIDRLRVTEGQVSFEDLSRPAPFRTQLRPINCDVVDFSTTGHTGNRYTLRGATTLGERFSWDGTFKVAPLTSRGQFEVANLQARTVWSYLRDALDFELAHGAIGLAGEYDLAAQKELALTVALRSADVAELAIRPKGRTTDYMQHANVHVDDARVDLARERVEVGKMRLTGGTVHAWRDTDGTINLMELLAPPTKTSKSPRATDAASAPTAIPTADTSPTASAADASAADVSAIHGSGAPGSAADASATDDSATESSGADASSGAKHSPPAKSSWTIAAPDIAVENLRVELEDRLVKPKVTFTLAPIAINVQGYDSASDGALDVDGKLAINDTAHLAAHGKLEPDTGAVSGHIDLDGFDLATLQPYVNTYTQISLLSGSLKSGLDFTLGADGAVTVKGDGDVIRFHTIDNALRQDLVKWDQLRVTGIEYQSTPASLRIARIDARKPYARVIIAPDQSLNITELLTPTPGSAPPAAVQTIKTSQGATKAPGGNPGAMQLRVGNVKITNGSANFADFWIQPNYAVSIQGLHGTVVGLSSAAQSRAKVDLSGKVDRYAPAEIHGDINLLSAALFTNMKVSFKGVEMSSVTPYAGRFAGYKIEKGKLSIDVAYRVENRQLTAEQRFVIDQLQLGERVASPDAVRLPVRLAVALLKDRNGVIDVDLPISGSLDDPQFRIGPIIWKAVLNLLTKVVTAPFALLGKMFGGGEEMNQIDFEPGSATLDATAQERVTSIAKALQERPQLKLDIPVSYSRELDAAEIAKRTLDEKLSAVPEPAQRFDMLMEEYKSLYGADTPPPQNAANVLALPKKKRPPESYDAANEELTRAIVEKQPASDSDLEQLAQARAHAIQDALLGSGELDPSRVFILGTNATEPADGKIRLALALK
ncbi:MAG TPA: DUF748 domain-containing protein [Steroidobacteraceae bacterium]|nr:DUF748 domain-containing protein [Steroidobacteraceae bacterium]